MSNPGNQLTSICEEAELESLLKKANGVPLVLLFAAKWSEESGTVEQCMVRFAHRDRYVMSKVDADGSPSLLERFSVNQLPTVVFLENGKVVDRLVGFNVPELMNKLKFRAKLYIPGFDKSDDLETRLRKLISSSKIMVFMKGTKQQPVCKFSRALVEILNKTGVDYETFNVFEDEDVREGLKKLSNWPTYPQVYVDGSLIGGLDVIRELEEAQELLPTLKGNATKND